MYSGNLTIVEESVFDVDVKILVNPVNCAGAMGAGLAKQFKERFSTYGYFEDYQKICKNEWMDASGGITMFETSDKIIVNFPTKTHWKKPSRIQYIKAGLASLADWCVSKYDPMGIHALNGELPSIAMPALGCGLGGLPYQLVWEEINKFSLEVPNHVYLCLPGGIPGTPIRKSINRNKK